MKRIAIATILGVISMGTPMTATLAGWILLNRTIMGFVIGISGLRFHWALHGPLMGLIIGSIVSYAAFVMQRPTVVVAGALIGSVAFGFLIDLFTTVVFKRPQQERAPSVTKPPAMAA